MPIASKSWTQDLINKVFKKAKTDDFFSCYEYGKCTNGGEISIKYVQIDNYKLKVGSKISVNFETMNKATNPKLNVNNTGAKPIKQFIGGQYITPIEFPLTSEFVYDGNYWILMTSCKKIYSNNETCIGIWSDGRPIYRKVIKTTVPIFYRNNAYVVGEIDDYNEIIRCDGSVYYISYGDPNNDYGWVNSSFKNWSDCLMLCWVESKKVYFINAGFKDNTTLYITVEYTKP